MSPYNNFQAYYNTTYNILRGLNPSHFCGEHKLEILKEILYFCLKTLTYSGASFLLLHNIVQEMFYLENHLDETALTALTAD